MSDKLQTLKGFRDFVGDQAQKRLWLIDKIKTIFKQFGFEPLETPALEYESLLTGKYGAEADKLIYSFEDRGGRRVALRYDQTIPTARVIAQYKNELAFPFRRYQIQQVWRADKPQKGRYREFTQCDVDIFGSNSPIADAEILACTYFSFMKVGFPNIKLYINDRQTLLTTLKPYATPIVSVFSIIQSIDKFDKIGDQGVIDELIKKRLDNGKAQEAIKNIQNASITTELKNIIDNAVALGIKKDDLIFTPTLARGLDYYTGMIFEVLIPGYEVGSLGGGGRYDELIGKLSGSDVAAVGIAFGFDRMLEAADQFKLLPTDTNTSTVLVTVFDTDCLDTSLMITNALREAKIKTEIYPGVEKMDKQLKFANKKGLEYVIIIGPEEKEKNLIKLKNMNTGEQKILTLQETISQLKNSQ